jgi:hypothetical protein
VALETCLDAAIAELYLIDEADATITSRTVQSTIGLAALIFHPQIYRSVIASSVLLAYDVRLIPLRVGPSENNPGGQIGEDEEGHVEGTAVKWCAQEYPFRHFVAQDVLDADAYRRVGAAFTAILERTEAGDESSYVLRKTNPKYDALMLGMNEVLAPNFYPFFSLPWLQALARQVAVPEVRRFDGGLHSNPKGSRTGWIHTDLCSGWFDESSSQPGLFPRRKLVDYFTGAPKSKQAKPVEYVRAATMIFYLCNDGWSPGDGGETGLYASSYGGADASVALIPPINNSALLFECSPHSYHRFIANPGRARNSIILWLHATVQKAESRWGGGIHRRKASTAVKVKRSA